MATHDSDTFEGWYKEKKEYLEYHKIPEDRARLIFDAGRISAFNTYITLISEGKIIVV